MEAIEWDKLDWHMEPTNSIVVFKTTFNLMEATAVLNDGKWNVSVRHEFTKEGHITSSSACEAEVSSDQLDCVVRNLSDRIGLFLKKDLT